MALSNAERQKNYRRRKRGASRAATDPVLELLESLPRIRATHDGPYTYTDRAKDFLSVFGGASTPDQGRRVLSQIHQICDPPPLRSNADKPGTNAFDNGMRRVMAEIMTCMVAKEPVTIERSANVDRSHPGQS